MEYEIYSRFTFVGATLPRLAVAVRRLPVVLKALGANLRRMRESRAMTQAELAHAVGIAPRYAQQIEHAQASPSLRLLVALAAVFERDVLDLLAPSAPAPKRNPGRPRRSPPG